MLKLRPYQSEGAEFLHRGKRKGLGDAPGLGKTFTATEAAVLPVLVSCPTYLTDQWYEFLRAQYPNKRTMVAGGTRKDKDFVLKMASDFTIVNHEMFRVTTRKDDKGKIKTYSKFDMPTNINTLILDESHHFRGRKASQSERVLMYSQNIERVYELTATPIYKAADDLYMQLRILDPKIWTSYYDFVARFLTTSSNWGFRNKVTGIRRGSPLRAIMDNYWMIRSYEDVGMQLPDELSKFIRVPMSDETMRVYEKARDDFRTEEDVPLFSAIERLQYLRRLTVCPEKLSALHDYLDDLNEPSVIFCWFRDTALKIQKELGGGIIVDGGMAATERVRIAKATSNNHIIATMAAVSEGVDLTQFRSVSFFEEHYSPGMRYQALSRVRRGSEDHRPIVVATFNLAHTVDEEVHLAVEERRSDARDILRRSLI